MSVYPTWVVMRGGGSSRRTQGETHGTWDDFFLLEVLSRTVSSVCLPYVGSDGEGGGSVSLPCVSLDGERGWFWRCTTFSRVCEMPASTLQ